MPESINAAEAPTLFSHFKLAMNNESQAATLYVKFKEMFKTDLEATTFWDVMNKDELRHLALLKEIFASLASDILKQPTDAVTFQQAVKAQKDLDQVNLNNITNLDQAFELAHDLEFSEINIVFIYLVSCYHYSEEKLDMIIEEIDSHQVKLMDFGAEHRTKNWRRSILANLENI